MGVEIRLFEVFIKDNSRTIEYENGDWRYHDKYFGGEPYGGREIVHYRGKRIG